MYKYVKTIAQFLSETMGTVKLFIAITMAYSCCFSLEGNLDFPDFLQKSYITWTAGTIKPSNIVSKVLFQ